MNNPTMRQTLYCASPVPVAEHTLQQHTNEMSRHVVGMGLLSFFLRFYRSTASSVSSESSLCHLT